MGKQLRGYNCLALQRGGFSLQRKLSGQLGAAMVVMGAAAETLGMNWNFLGCLRAVAARILNAAPTLRWHARCNEGLALCSDNCLFCTICFCAAAGKTSAAAKSLGLFIKWQFFRGLWRTKERRLSSFRERLTRRVEKE